MASHFPTEENLEKVMSATGTGSSLIVYYFIFHFLTSTFPEGEAISTHDSQDSHRDSSDQESEVAHEPIQERYGNPSYSRFRRVASKTVVSFGLNDPENPVNWRKVM